MQSKKNKPVLLETLIDKHIGKIGTPKRDAFEYKLHVELSQTVAKQKCRDRK
jgi:hypothetical protein